MIDHASRRQLQLQFMQFSLRESFSAKHGIRTDIMAPAAPAGSVLSSAFESTANMPPTSIPIVT